MDPKMIWVGRGLGAIGLLMGLVVAFRYMITREPSDIFVGIGIAAVLMIAAWIYMDWDIIAAVSGRRGTRRQAGSWAMVLLVLGIVVLVNYLSANHSWEKDVTEGSVHSLAPQTIEVLENLDREVQVTAFYRMYDATGESGSMRETFRELIGRYKNHSGYIQFKVIDPDVEPRLAVEYGVYQNGVVFLACGGREERVISPDENDLTNALIKVTRTSDKKIYFLTGHGEHSLSDIEAVGYSQLKQKLVQTGFQVEELELIRRGVIPADATVLVIAGPVTPLLDTEVPLVRDFVERRGGSLLVLLDPERTSGLEPTLRRWGVQVGDDIIIDLGGILIGDSTTVFGDFGYHEITDQLAVPAILSQARTVGPAEGSLESRELLRSSDTAWAKRNLEDLSDEYDPETDELGPLSLAAIVDVPRLGAPPPSFEDDDSAADTRSVLEQIAGSEAERPGTVIVYGDSDLASNASLTLFGNQDLVLNSLSYLAREKDLISIRANEAEDRPLELTQLETALVWVISFPGATLLVVLMGIVAWFVRLAR